MKNLDLTAAFMNRIFRGHVLSQDASAEQYVVFLEIRVHNYLCFTLISDWSPLLFIKDSSADNKKRPPKEKFLDGLLPDSKFC